MMRNDVISIEKVKPINDYVLLKPKSDYDIIDTKSGIELYIDTDTEARKHVPVVCEVVKISDKLKKENIKPGDEVVVDYMALSVALNVNDEGDPAYLLFENEKYVFLKFRKIYAIKRDGEITMLNDYNIFEALETERQLLEKRLNKSGLFMPENTKPQYREWAKVFFTNKEIVKEINAGDKVFLAPHSDMNIEYPLHKKFFSVHGPNYIVVKNLDVLARSL